MLKEQKTKNREDQELSLRQMNKSDFDYSYEVKKKISKYYPEDDENNLYLIKKMLDLSNCTILNFGLRPTKEPVDYYYCNCDINNIHPLCKYCAENCHKTKGHLITLQKEPANIRCWCGEKGHNVNDLQTDYIYDTKCYFHELAIYSKMNLIFFNEQNQKICLFCNNFCNNSQIKSRYFFTEMVPECECSHENHKDKFAIYSNIDNFPKIKQSEIFEISSVKLCNLLIKCQLTYKTFYSMLERDLEGDDFLSKVAIIFNNKKIHRTNFFYAIKNLALNSKSSKGLRYFSNTLSNLPPFTDKFIYIILKKRFDDSISTWTLINYLLIAFKNITLGNDGKVIVKFKLFDLENMSALQRLVLLNKNKDGYTRFIQKYINADQNIINLLLETLSKTNFTKFVHLEGIQVLCSIVSILKYLANFYLFTPNQILNFCEEIEKSLSNLFKIRTKRKYISMMKIVIEEECKFYLKVVKILRILIYSYNDQVVLNTLNIDSDEIQYDKIKFIQDKLEIAKSITRINTIITYYISTIYSQDNKEFYTIFNKILRQGKQIINLFSNTVDIYSLSLKRITPNKKGYLEILIRSENPNNKSKQIVEFLDEKTNSIENMYSLYNNLEIKDSQIIEEIILAVDKFFEFFDIPDLDTKVLLNEKSKGGHKSKFFNTKFHDKGDEIKILKEKNSMIEKKSNRNDNYTYSKLNNENNSDLETLEKMRNILYQSNFLFTIFKLFKMTKLEADSDLHKNLINRLFKILWYFVENNRENAILVLSHNIYDSLDNIPNQNAVLNFELILYCVKLISNNEEYGFTKHLIKNISNSLFSLPDDHEDLYICLNYFLKIIDVIVHNIRSLNFKLTLGKIKDTLNFLNRKFSIFNELLEFLKKITNIIIKDSLSNIKLDDFDENDSSAKTNFKFQLKNSNSNFNLNNSLALNIFYIFLKTINSVYDSSSEVDREYISSLFKKDDLILILKNQYLNLNLRTEIIKFYRKNHIDIIARTNKESIGLYIKSFINQIDQNELNHQTSNNFPAKIYSFYESLMRVSDNSTNNMNKSVEFSTVNLEVGSKFDKDTNDLIFFELKNYKNIVESSLLSDGNRSSSILNYFENGLIITLKLYLKRIFALVNLLTGDEFLNVFEMFSYILKMKKYFLEKNIEMPFIRTNQLENDDSENKKEKINEMFREIHGFTKLESNISPMAMKEASIREIERCLDKIKSINFPAFDYSSSYTIIHDYLFSMILKPTSYELENNYSKMTKEIEEKYYLEFHDVITDNIKCNNEKNILKIGLQYELRKGNLELENSAISQCLSQVCSHYEETYSALIIKFLIFLSTHSKFIKEQFSYDAFFILFKLLQYHTAEIQKDLKNILEEQKLINLEEKKKKKKKKKSSKSLNTNDEEKEKSGNIDEEFKISPLTVVKNENEKDKNINKSEFLKLFADELINKFVVLFISYFNRRDVIFRNDYTEAYSIIKLFKFLCEEHNNYFQGNFVKSIEFKYDLSSLVDDKKENTKTLNFFDLMLLILNKIIVWSGWNFELKNQHFNNFYLDIFYAIIELLIEIIQGNSVDNLSYITIIKKKEDLIPHKNNIPIISHKLITQNCSITPFQLFFQNINKNFLFEINDNNPVLYSLRTNIMEFLLTILEEKNCSLELKSYIIESLSINKVISSINTTLKLYFIEKTKNDKYWEIFLQKNHNNFNQEDNHQNKADNNSSFNNELLIFDENLYKYFYDQYFIERKGFPESPEFEFANKMYRYIKLISLPPYSAGEAFEIIQKTNETPMLKIIGKIKMFKSHTKNESVQNVKEKYSLIYKSEKFSDSNFILNYFIIKFFEQITQMVEVSHEEISTTVIFTVVPTIHNLSMDSKLEFINNVNRENQFTKTYDLVKIVEVFKTEIEYNTINSGNKIYSILNNLNYSLIQNALYVLALTINLLMLFTLKGDVRIFQDYGNGYNIPPSINMTSTVDSSNKTNLTLVLRSQINNTIYTKFGEWELNYEILTAFLIIFSILFICCYIFAKIPLYYEIEIRKFIDAHKIERENVSLFQKIKIILNDIIIERNHINSLIIFTVFGFLSIGLNSANLEIFYSFLLLPIVVINSTLKNIIISIKLEYKGLVATFVFTFFLIYTFSNLAFYFMSWRYDTTDLMLNPENYCDSLMFCFLTHANTGFRIEGGIGEAMGPKAYLSYERNSSKYAGRLIFDLISFIIINVLMREIVFGIIIESFRDLRIEETYHEKDKLTKCFICGVTKDTLEKEKINFKKHCEKDHNLWNYINYMIGLKFSDPQNLNAVNSYTLEQIEKKFTNWIPKYNSNKNEITENSEEQEEVSIDFEDLDKLHNPIPIKKNY